jgi:hypothetical protein
MGQSIAPGFLELNRVQMKRITFFFAYIRLHCLQENNYNKLVAFISSYIHPHKYMHYSNYMHLIKLDSAITILRVTTTAKVLVNLVIFLV